MSNEWTERVKAMTIDEVVEEAYRLADEKNKAGACTTSAAREAAILARNATRTFSEDEYRQVISKLQSERDALKANVKTAFDLECESQRTIASLRARCAELERVVKVAIGIIEGNPAMDPFKFPEYARAVLAKGGK